MIIHDGESSVTTAPSTTIIVLGEDSWPEPDVQSFRIDAGTAFDNRIESVSLDFSEPVIVSAHALTIRDKTGEPVNTFLMLSLNFGSEMQDSVASVAGDANLNSTVEFGDFLLLSANFGASGATWTPGDFNGDSLVRFADFLAFSNNFGKSIATEVNSAFAEQGDWWSELGGP